MLYFDHDTDASKSDEINDLRCLCGGAAVDAYWYILEQIYRQETRWVFYRNQQVNPSVLRLLAVDGDTFAGWVQTMVELDLLSPITDNDGCVYAVMSPRASERIEQYHKRAETARENGKNGGRPAKNKPKETQSVSDGIPRPNPGKPTSKAKKREEKRRDRFSLKEKPISLQSETDVENPYPQCPECGYSMRFEPEIPGWRCMGGSCRFVVKKRDAGLFGMSAYCKTCGVMLHPNKQTARHDCPECMNSYEAEDAIWR